MDLVVFVLMDMGGVGGVGFVFFLGGFGVGGVGVVGVFVGIVIGLFFGFMILMGLLVIGGGGIIIINNLSGDLCDDINNMMIFEFLSLLIFVGFFLGMFIVYCWCF